MSAALVTVTFNVPPALARRLCAVVDEDAGAADVTPSSLPDILTLEQAVAHTQLSEKTIRNAIKSGALKKSGATRHIRIARVDLDAWMASPGAAVTFKSP